MSSDSPEGPLIPAVDDNLFNCSVSGVDNDYEAADAGDIPTIGTGRNRRAIIPLLRQKLGPARNHVETVVGVGYRFVIQAPTA